ncbi:class I SAM-dependent methyltransferase [Ideonella sp.]|uniref:class I SAM-dependent methyltransferase n=1 Tax=Ideonella sp. TaxID=1929293 RepID=UPI002B481485|nr:class I SAM-dependent methyltransferase [Ideonella sp.]HJV68070.1 class I SAM-dependent methyltransferase [Ideonella sp.]
MTQNDAIIELGLWLGTPPGRYLLEWEQARLDRAVADIFGFHALQIGLPEIDTLRSNRMPHRWVASDSLTLPSPIELPPLAGDAGSPASLGPVPVALHCEHDALPFADQALDLVVLPHTLEQAADPHRTLAEVARVLRPEGKVVIVGLNPVSLWGVRQRLGHARLRLAREHGGQRSLFLPRAGEFIGYWRARDWLRLLGFEIEAGSFGCWRPPMGAQRWLDRFAWMDRVGSHWWPVFGAVYCLVAVKRVRGLRLIGLARSERVKPQGTPVLNRSIQFEEEGTT